MKYVYLVLAILFTLFAYWQFNDPDAMIWVVVYFLVSIMHFLAFRGVYLKWASLLATVAALLWMFSMWPQFNDWIDSGMPSIASEMKTDQPHIEVVREFLGLLICGVAMAHLSIQAFRAPTT